MKKYEVMVIVKADLNEDDRKSVFNQVNDAITKLNAKITSSGLWAEKRKLFFTIKKQREGMYYLADFDLDPQNVSKLNNAYRLNENILRALITVRD